MKPRALLLVGSTGFLGGLVAAGLLAETQSTIVAPIRSSHTRESVLATIREELVREGVAQTIDFERFVTVPLDFAELADACATYGVSEILHCAGSVDYFNSQKLREANIDLTTDLLGLAKRFAMRRFVFLSTAFSSGYVDGVVRERFHEATEGDPTEYITSKRDAERLVATSGIPYLIVRPSIVIGDSRDGRYSGKAYGLYQFWSAFERFLSDRYRDALHVIAPHEQLQLVHQDSFKNGFIAACAHMPDDTIIHLTSRGATLPTSREISQLWFETIARPHEVFYYSGRDAVENSALDRRMKTFLEFTAVNSELSAHRWRFEDSALRGLCERGLRFAHTTIETVRICQDQFVAQSHRLQAYLEKNKEQFPSTKPDVVEVNPLIGGVVH